MTDRPAAELLAEIVPMFAEDRSKGRTLSVWADAYVYALRRLDRAEGQLAAIEGLCNGDAPSWVTPAAVVITIRAALRATQGGQT